MARDYNPTSVLKRRRQTVLVGRNAFRHLWLIRPEGKIVLGGPSFKGLPIEGTDIVLPNQRNAALADPSFDFALGKFQGVGDFFDA